MCEETKSLFTPENMVMGILLGGLAWGGTQIVNIKDAQATLATQQIENTRVNEIVYKAIPAINLSLNTLVTDQKHMNNKLDGMYTVVSNLKNGGYAETKLTNELILLSNGDNTPEG